VKVAALLIIALSHDGYWFGGVGHGQTVTVSWAIEQPLPPAELSWSLIADDVTLLKGASDMPATVDSHLAIKLEPPKVRTRTSARWTFDLRKRDGTGSLARGSVPVELFADDAFDGLAKRVGQRRLSVIDPGGAIVKLLDGADVPHTRLDDADALRVSKVDLALVAPGGVSGKNATDAVAISQAGAGASVFFFEQTLPQRLGGYLLLDRKPDNGVVWRADHPLFRGLTETDLQSLTRSRPLKAMQLPTDEPALELAYWPAELQPERSTMPRPIDALVVTKTTAGGGRLVFCQLPLTDIASDPRAQLMLVNAIDYLVTRPQPTPPLSQRGDVPRLVPPTIPTITISPGER